MSVVYRNEALRQEPRGQQAGEWFHRRSGVVLPRFFLLAFDPSFDGPRSSLGKFPSQADLNPKKFRRGCRIRRRAGESPGSTDARPLFCPPAGRAIAT